VISLSGAGYAVFTTMGDTLRSFLYWFEFLAPAVGLSGVAILVLGLVLFLLFIFVVNWVFAGFAGQSKNQGNSNSR
jgi:hypothetical protein